MDKNIIAILCPNALFIRTFYILQDERLSYHRPAMTIAVDMGRKATKTKTKSSKKA